MTFYHQGCRMPATKCRSKHWSAGVRVTMPPLLVPQPPIAKEPGMSPEWQQLLMPFWRQPLMIELVPASWPPKEWNLVPGCRLSPCHPLASAWMMTPCEWQLDCGWEPHSANHTTATTVVTQWMSLHCMASAVENVRAAIRAMQPSICCCRGL